MSEHTPGPWKVDSKGKAETTIEALQRERDDAVLIRDHNLRMCEALDSKYKKVLADLDAERERYELLNVERNAIDDKRHVLHEQLANTIEAAAQQEGELAEIQALAANLKSQLTQLQALVRALFEFKCDGKDFETIRQALKTARQEALRDALRDLDSLHWKEHWYADQLRKKINDRLVSEGA